MEEYNRGDKDMDETRKSVIRLKHWIDHNLDHLMGYKEVAAHLGQKGFKDVVAEVEEGIGHVEQANKAFEKALARLEEQLGAPEPEEQERRHDH
jgi:hypothetical protein